MISILMKKPKDQQLHMHLTINNNDNNKHLRQNKQGRNNNIRNKFLLLSITEKISTETTSDKFKTKQRR